ncbi:HNH endonuclease signature motif containing protein [Cryobacterium sp. MLB-32]|uniref:HNH endonuclease signature motif containing protein n=1 Tax=Cryobacterium sp. MLB-32 TaxID=1529318 RepID=UPI000691CCC3|nr:HNH endonuclease signature motif containing protein [Cryobacterium sp. MLB-32]
MENNDDVPPLEDAAGSNPPEPVDQTLALLAEEKAVADDTQTLLLDAVLSFDRMVCFAQAARAEVIDKLRQWTDTAAEAGLPAIARARRDIAWSPQKAAHEGLVAELAALLKLPGGVARDLMFESDLLQHRLPATREALRRGDISYRHAQIIIENAVSLPPEAWKVFEDEALRNSETLTVPQLRKKAIKVRELTHPESIAIRHQKALADRNFWVSPGRDGMGYLEMTLSNEDATAIANRVEALAKNLKVNDETRTLAQLRTDCVTDLLLHGVTDTGLGAGIRANVFVTVPVLTLMGTSEEPGTLEGFGPIDPETARRLAGTATSFTRILVHPETGAVLSFGRTKYKVPEDLRNWLRLRDGTCRAVGCNRRATDCDIDHTIAWEHGGETVFSNLSSLCRPSHRVKHETGWSVVQGEDGTLNWTSPAGRHYATHPETRIRPTIPQMELALTKKPRTYVDPWTLPVTESNECPL